jgi:hypothetical protein
MVSRFAKFLVAAVVTALTFGIGHHELPTKPLAKDLVQPTITVFASRPGVTATVGMSASSFVRVPAAPGDPASVTGYAFNLTLKIAHPPLAPVKFLVVLSDFPAVTAVGVTPLSPLAPIALPAAQIAGGVPNPAGDALGRSDYLATPTYQPAGAAITGLPGAEPTVHVTTLLPVVSALSGPELQVTYPFVQAGTLSQTAPAGTAWPAAEILARYQVLPAPPTGKYYEPDLDPGDTLYHVNGHLNLADFATLAGDPPTVKPRGLWSWTAVSDVSLLAQDALTADVDQEHLFWAGVILGVAAASGIAAVIELTSAIQETRKAGRARRAARVAPGRAAST